MRDPAHATGMSERMETPSAATRGDANEAQHALAAVQADWNAAAGRWDPEALTAVYTPDAAMFAGRPGHALGEGGVRQYFGSYVGVIERAVMSLRDQHILVHLPDLVLAQGYVDFTFRLAGDRTSASCLRTTLTLARRQGRWKILQHHFSATPAEPPLG
jgi:uncharacterized protein (TIGR02246 family)